jgi:hypothetical protein
MVTACQAKFGLDQPLYVQYVTLLSDTGPRTGSAPRSSSTLRRFFRILARSSWRSCSAPVSMPVSHAQDFYTRVTQGTARAYLNGHGGSTRDPYFTLSLYHSRHIRPTGTFAEY